MISTCMNPFQCHQSESYIVGEAISKGNLVVNMGGVWVLMKDAVAATLKQNSKVLNLQSEEHVWT